MLATFRYTFQPWPWRGICCRLYIAEGDVPPVFLKTVLVLCCSAGDEQCPGDAKMFSFRWNKHRFDIWETKRASGCPATQADTSALRAGVGDGWVNEDEGNVLFSTRFYWIFKLPSLSSTNETKAQPAKTAGHNLLFLRWYCLALRIACTGVTY